MKVSDIITIIENMAPPAFAAPWDRSGVQVAGLRQQASRVAVTLDPTLESLTRAAEDGADFILAHHPLSMQPRYPDRQDEYLSILSLLFRRDIWLYSAHTSLDANPAGPVRWLAAELALQEVGILEPTTKVGEAGARGATGPTATGGAHQCGFGFTGRLAEPLPYADFCRLLGRILGREQWQTCAPPPATVRRLACCPGSGGGLLGPAAASGADLYITGDIKYHVALEARSLGLHVLDVGHFILEEEMMRRLALALAADCSLPVTFVPGADPIACPARHRA